MCVTKRVSQLCPSQPTVMRGHQVENYNIMSTLRRRQHTHERNGGVNFFDKKDEMGRARVEEVRQRAEQLRTELIEQIDGQLNDLIDDVLHDLDSLEPRRDHTYSGCLTLSVWYFDKYAVKDVMKCCLKMGNFNLVQSEGGNLDKVNGNKVFVPRQSVLTELLEVSHIKTIYNIFVALLIVFIINTVVYDYIDSGSLSLELSILKWAFGKPSTVVSIWLVMKAMALFAFPIFSAWHSNRHSWLPLPDLFWLLLYITYLTVFAIFPVQEVIQHNLPPASSIIILAEQIRFMLKIHAFVRESAPKVLSYEKTQDDSDPLTEDQDQADEGADNATNRDKTVKNNQPLPEFGQYLYFLFCPTLIYRDQYPMTPHIRWNYVVSNSLQTLACIFYTYYVFARFCVPVFRNIGKGQWSFKHFTLSVFSCMLPGTMVLVLGFFAILHSWLNAFAEMTRFADRMFYKDWWNSNSYADYYRSWNVVVHDWLYAYIYKDMVKIIKNRQVATVSVFIMSAIVHEYVLMFAFRFFYPMLLFLFGVFGLSFVFLKPKKHANVSQVWNVFMWITLIVGNGLLMCLYSQEWFATQICPRNSNSLLDQMSPRSWNVECVQVRVNSG